MKNLCCFDRTLALLGMLLATSAQAALIVNPPASITEVVKVQPIIVSDNSGGNTAEFFGTASQLANIQDMIDTIWAQASIDIDWLPLNRWYNTPANNGSLSLSQLSDLGAAVGVTNSDPYVVNLFFVEITYGSSDNGENSVNGFGWVGANGIMEAVGDNLPTFSRGREIVARVTAHEIGHNLSLPHIVESQNLMEGGGTSNPGERLLPGQVANALNSLFSVPILADSADFDFDGDTDGLDFMTWQQFLGDTGSEGDANHDQKVDGLDRIIWQNKFGNFTTSESTQMQIVPEPSVFALVVLLFITRLVFTAEMFTDGFLG